MLIIILASLSGMFMTFTTQAFSATATVAVSAAKSDIPQNTVSVGVSAQHSGGKIVYHYRVTNYTQQDLSAISIGREHKNDNGIDSDVYELLELPSGWNDKFGIPSASSNTPTGWRVSLTGPDETATDITAPDKSSAVKAATEKAPTVKVSTENSTVDKAATDKAVEPHAITWEVMNDRSPALSPGQSMSKLSITLDKADPNYLAGHATVTFSAGIPTTITVPVERLDNTPPVLTVTLSPDKIPLSSTRPVAVKAAFSTSDDDRLPEIKLESITANEPLETGDVLDATLGRDDRYLKFRALSKTPEGRIYTAIYSATDASGNQALASATVTVIPATETPPTAASVPVVQPQTSNAQTATPPGTPLPR